jgi:hypothetical protein
VLVLQRLVAQPTIDFSKVIVKQKLLSTTMTHFHITAAMMYVSLGTQHITVMTIFVDIKVNLASMILKNALARRRREKEISV